jgi:hypothetical protein
MKIEAALYCSECQEVFDRIDGYKCPVCNNQGTGLLLAISKDDVLRKEKVNSIIIIILLALVSWVVVFAAFYGAAKLVELIF